MQGCTERQRDTRRVPDGQECRTVRSDNGDGTFSERQQCTTKYRSEPVYDDWCTWNGTRWDYERSVTAAGSSLNETPYWAEYNLNCEGTRSVGCERVSNRIEEYNVIYHSSDTDHDYRCGFSQQDWEATGIESLWVGQVGRFNQADIDCDSLERK